MLLFGAHDFWTIYKKEMPSFLGKKHGLYIAAIFNTSAPKCQRSSTAMQSEIIIVIKQCARFLDVYLSDGFFPVEGGLHVLIPINTRKHIHQPAWMS